MNCLISPSGRSNAEQSFVSSSSGRIKRIAENEKLINLFIKTPTPTRDHVVSVRMMLFIKQIHLWNNWRHSSLKISVASSSDSSRFHRLKVPRVVCICDCHDSHQRCLNIAYASEAVPAIAITNNAELFRALETFFFLLLLKSESLRRASCGSCWESSSRGCHSNRVSGRVLIFTLRRRMIKKRCSWETLFHLNHPWAD